MLLNIDTRAMQANSSLSAQSSPIVLETLPNFAVPDGVCPRRARMQIDFLLLAIEALDLSGSESFLSVANELELQSIIKNRVNLWRLRSTNPVRRSSQRDPMNFDEAKALVLVICHHARRLTMLIRQLLIAQQQLDQKGLSYNHHFRLWDYLERFRTHFRSRMNPNRAAIKEYSDEKLDRLALKLLGQLLFCTGTAGTQRLWSSLFDGEVA
jgi:hypothetical protein